LAKSGFLGFAMGAKPNVSLAGGLKLILKNAGRKKIKNTGSAMSVDLLVVRVNNGLYVVQLSKLFVLFKCSIFSRLFHV
jgi:hypothetical protein